MEYSIIYDKMRLFLEREKKHKMAVRFAIFSYFSWAIGLYIQNRKEELIDFISQNFIKRRVEKLLHDDKKEALNRIITIIETQLKNYRI